MSFKTLVLSLVAVVLLSDGLARADTLAERLEKGIYTEETVGDLDAARDIYRKIVADAKADRVVAAQAQFRLAQCFLKQEKEDEAIAAFKKLIKDFADQKALVAKAKKYVPLRPDFKMLPEPWVDGESLQYRVKLASGHDIGTFVFSVRSSREDGKGLWLTNTGRYIHLNAPNQGVSRVKADRNTFRPLSSLFRHSILGQFEATYTRAEVTIDTVSRDEGKSSSRKVEVDGIHYDSGQAMHLFRRLPLAKDFKAKVPLFVALADGPIESDPEVTALETIEVPAGTFECYRLHSPKLQETYWISTDEHRYPVKFEGGGVVGLLDSIRVNKPGEMVEYRDEVLGFSMAAPSDWYFVKRAGEDNYGREVYQILDPEAEALSTLRVRPIEKARENKVDSSRAWAQMRVKKREKLLKDFKVRSESWAERTISGHPGVSFISDHRVGDKKMVQYYVCSLGESTIIEFFTIIDRDKFDAFRGSFDAIIDTYREKSE